MNYGLQIAASGALTSLYRMDVLANNLANLNTVGFKPERVATLARPPERLEDGVYNLPSDALLERLGGGVLMAPNRTDFSQGALETTGNPLDLAIDGRGFFVVEEFTGSGETRLCLTRDGRMTRAADGTLVTASAGLRVLDPSHKPIVLPHDGPIAVASDGEVSVDGVAVGRLAVVEVANLDRLERRGESLFVVPQGARGGLRAAGGLVRQGHVESSSVNPIDALMQIENAARAAQANLTSIAHHDQLLEMAVGRFARVV